MRDFYQRAQVAPPLAFKSQEELDFIPDVKTNHWFLPAEVDTPTFVSGEKREYSREERECEREGVEMVEGTQGELC